MYKEYITMPTINRTQEEMLEEDIMRWIYDSHCWDWDKETYDKFFTCIWCGDKVFRNDITDLKICRNNPVIKKLK